MAEEYFDYTFDENETIVNVGGSFNYIVVINTLDDIQDYANEYFISKVDYGSWEDDGHTYRPGKILSINRNCDGSFTVVFELEIVY